MESPLVVTRPEGLYCAAGDFYIDPWRPVERALITHAHADHARSGHARYLAASPARHVLRQRLGDVTIDLLDYGQAIEVSGVRVSFHPAGHVLGSSQVRLEYRGDVWVVSGDYKLAPDPTCLPFEPLPCNTFITESTFGLPIYRWAQPSLVFDEINGWWRGNADAGRASILFAYAFGKAQRVAASVDAQIGPIVCHGAVEVLNNAYRKTGVALPATLRVGDIDAAELNRALVLAPPSAQSTPWLRRFGNYSDAFASGWMQLRGARRRRAVDRGFVLSDHADWPALLQAIAATGATRVIVTHGYAAVLVRWLQQHGIQAETFDTEYGEDEEERAADDSEPALADAATRAAEL